MNLPSTLDGGPFDQKLPGQLLPVSLVNRCQSATQSQTGDIRDENRKQL